MSIKIMSKIWELGPDAQSERFVLLALADYANDDGECWPSVAGISRKTCLTDRGVRKIMRRLEETGWLEIEAGGGRKNCNIYRIKTLNRVQPERRSALNVVLENPEPGSLNPEPGSAEPPRTTIKPDTTLEDKSSNGASADPAKIIFTAGLAMLVQSGRTEQQARGILGKWRKNNSDGVVIEALGKAQREGAIDPVAFCEGIFRHTQKTAPKKGFVNAGAFGNIPERN